MQCSESRKEAARITPFPTPRTTARVATWNIRTMYGTRKKNNKNIQVATYLLMPIAPVEYRPSTNPRHRTLFWAALVIPDQLIPCCFSSASVSRIPTVARPASLPLPLRVPGQGLACGAGCWLPEGVSDPAPLPPQYLLGHWFLPRSLPQIFISDLLLPLDWMRLRQVLKNVWIFCCIVCVVRHVSHP